MCLYQSVVKPILFKLEPETAHHFAFKQLKYALSFPLIRHWAKHRYMISHSFLERKLWGLTFPTPVGLAAGFDKNALLIDELACLGFGFIEIGTVTPRPQEGNPKPRLFRLPEDKAIINRMGFNNDGVDVVVNRLKKRTSSIIVGGNIGKNKTTPNENAIDDYLICFEKLFDYVDYFTVNVSSPNTPNLRQLQDKKPLAELLTTLQNANHKHTNPKPLLLKIAPDLTTDQLNDIINITLETELQGIIATNTTISRQNLRTSSEKIASIGVGGLSGKPLAQKSTDVIRYLAKNSNQKFDIVGVGGIHSAEDAINKIEAGAKLVQLYTGLIYEGISLPSSVAKALLYTK